MNVLRLAPLALVVLSACGGSPCDPNGDCFNQNSCIYQAGNCEFGPAPAAPILPCGGVPFDGECVDAKTAQRCIVASGNSEPRVSRTVCGAGEVCGGGAGGAQCRLSGECREGDTRCSAGYQVCKSGRWTAATCTGSCRATVSGAVCETVPTQVVKMKFSFEAKQPNAEYSDWAATATSFTAAGFMVVSSTAAGLLDVTTTAGDGTFSIRVPMTPRSSDRLSIAAVHMDGDKVGLMVANPALPSAGLYEAGAHSANAYAWSWSVPWTYVKENAEVLANVGNGSAAAWVFADAAYAYRKSREQFGRSPLPLVIWLAKEASWTCGKCQWVEPVTVGNVHFDVQVALAGGSDEGYWSDTVTGHELGHWLMSSYGVPPNEGGPHSTGIATFPGQAWSEGWATYHQASLLGRPHYFDKQQGSMFRIDLEARDYSNTTWTRPTASQGLLQKIDENEVSAMLWQLHRSSTAAPGAIGSALASPRMTGTTFKRGYTRHTWDVAANGSQYNVVNTGTSAPHFADFLDALNCAGFSRAAIDQATEPAVHYPYPSQSPLCP
jgi:hypothetical protein